MRRGKVSLSGKSLNEYVQRTCRSAGGRSNAAGQQILSRILLLEAEGTAGLSRRHGRAALCGIPRALARFNRATCLHVLRGVIGGGTPFSLAPPERSDTGLREGGYRAPVLTLLFDNSLGDRCTGTTVGWGEACFAVGCSLEAASAVWISNNNNNRRCRRSSSGWPARALAERGIRSPSAKASPLAG